MADITITFTIPDAKLAEVLAALRWHFGPKGESGAQYTQAELRAKLRESMVNSVRDIYARYKKAEHEALPVDTDSGVS